jgi:hypothetical protein
METTIEQRSLQLLQLFIAQVQATGICNHPELTQVIHDALEQEQHTLHRAWQQQRQTRLLQLYIQEVKQTGKCELFWLDRPQYPNSDRQD